MKFCYREDSCFKVAVFEKFRKAGIRRISSLDERGQDYLLINGMKDFISIRKELGEIPSKYVFIDSGYIGNFKRTVGYIRVVPNGLHPVLSEKTPKKSSIDIIKNFDKNKNTSFYKIFKKKQNYKQYKTALLIPPSSKYCVLDGIFERDWTHETIKMIFKSGFSHTKVRWKNKCRIERMETNPIYNDFKGKKAMYCYSSLACIDALIFGIPFIDLGNGPLKHMSYTPSKIHNGEFINSEFIINEFDKLCFYQDSPKRLIDKLFEVVDFHESL